MSKRLTIEHCNHLASQRDGYCLSSEYINNNTKYKWKCKKGHIWTATFANIKGNGRWCPHCANLNKIKNTVQDCHNLAKKRSGEFLNSVYINNNTKYKWKCKKGHIWLATFRQIKEGRWCPHCALVRRKNTIQDCHNLARKKGGLFLSNEYINNRTKYKWRCELGHIWEATSGNIKNGKWCPKCLKKTQTHIFKIVKSMFPGKNVKYDVRNIPSLKGQEIDIYVPHIKLAIEYDGEQHFMPVKFGKMSDKKAEENFKKRQELDQLKNKKIAEHKEDFKHFIRFNYKENLTEQYIINKVKAILDGEKTG